MSANNSQITANEHKREDINMFTSKISVIVPVYKVEQYLPKCIKSILNQTFTDFELLLIDDGSPDRSGDICDYFAANDTRIRVFHKENGGVSSARNLGLDNARGEWVTFIDSDDFIGPAFLENLYHPCTADVDIDFVHCGCVDYTDNGLVSINQKYDKYISGDKNYLFNHFRGLTFSKLFNLQLISKYNVQFDEHMKYGEDMVFTIDYLTHINKYAFIESVDYYYVQRSDSAMHLNSKMSYQSLLHAFLHRYDSVQKYISINNISINDSRLRNQQTADSLCATILSLYDLNYDRTQRLGMLTADFRIEHYKYLSCCSSFIYRLLFIPFQHKYLSIGDFILLLSLKVRKFIIK